MEGVCPGTLRLHGGGGVGTEFGRDDDVGCGSLGAHVRFRWPLGRVLAGWEVALKAGLCSSCGDEEGWCFVGVLAGGVLQSVGGFGAHEVLELFGRKIIWACCMSSCVRESESSLVAACAACAC